MSKSIGEIVGDKVDDCRVGTMTSVREVIVRMHAKNLSAMAVMDGDRVEGVFALRDCVPSVVMEDADLSKVPVSEVMSSPAIWIADDERYEVAKAMLVDKGVRQLVVLNAERRFCGFITALELLQADLVGARELIEKLNDAYYAPKYATP